MGGSVDDVGIRTRNSGARVTAHAPAHAAGGQETANVPARALLSHRDRLNRDLLAFIGGRESRQTVDAGHASAP